MKEVGLAIDSAVAFVSNPIPAGKRGRSNEAVQQLFGEYEEAMETYYRHRCLMILPSAARKRSARQGTVAVEFALVAPVFFAVILGIVDHGRMMMVEQILVNAVNVGARAAILPGETDDEVTSTVDNCPICQFSAYLNVIFHQPSVVVACLPAAFCSVLSCPNILERGYQPFLARGPPQGRASHRDGVPSALNESVCALILTSDGAYHLRASMPHVLSCAPFSVRITFFKERLP